MALLILTGIPGSGKSLRAARLTIRLLELNRSWACDPRNPEPGALRPVVTNIKLSPVVEQRFGVGGFADQGTVGIIYWEHTRDLVKLRDCDVVWDEMGADIDAHDHASISRDLKRWVAQHRKRRIRIIGLTQDFLDIDISFRKKTDHLELLTKLVGSVDPAPNLPPVKLIWGVTLIRELDPRTYKNAASADETEEEQTRFCGFPKLMLWGRRDCEIYDSYAEVQTGDPPPLRHISQLCENPICNHTKIRHV